MATDPSIERAGLSGPETVQPFVATPERVSKYLNLKSDEVMAQMKSVEGRQQLFDQMSSKEEDIRRDHPDYHPDALRSQLEAGGEALLANEKFLENIKTPEKKGMLTRAWESVSGFARKHPVTTTLLAAAVVAGGIAGGLYMAGYWETAMAYVGLNKVLETAEAVGELTPVTPDVPPLPGGGVYDVPPPLAAPGEFPDVPY